ncbi:hypothetical protein GCM10009736_04250 [Actinomadura bangladeshensis]
MGERVRYPYFTPMDDMVRQLLTSNKAFSEWGQIFGDEVLATAILDRLLHHCEVIAINGPSYRLKNRMEAVEAHVATAG